MTMNQNESYADFVVRVMTNLEDYKLTKQEAFKTLFNREMANDNIRKVSYLASYIQEAVDSGYYKKFLGEGIIAPLKEEINSIYKSDEVIEQEDNEYLLKSNQQLRKQLQSVNDRLRILRAEQRNYHRTDIIWDKFLEDFKNINPIEIIPTTSKEYKQIAILNIADAHFGMQFENELNIYNKDVAVERFKIITQKTIEKLSPNTKLIVLQLGDEVSGIIHVNGRINSDLNIVESVKLFTETMLGMLKTFCENFAEVEYHSVHGNHSRITPSKEESLEKENFTCLSDWYIRSAMKGVVNFKFPTNRFFGIAEFNIFDKKIVGLHGHQTGFDSMTKVAHTVGYIPSQCNLGHHHLFQNKDLGRTRIVGSPSLCGIDSYASDKLLYGLPHQLLEVFYENGDKDTKEIYF